MEEKSKSKKNKQARMMYYAALVLIILAVVLGVIFWLKGETKIFGEFPNPESYSSITCKSVGFEYPFFTYFNARKNTLEVNIILADNKLEKISLSYMLNYDDENSIIKSETENHSIMNEHFDEDGLRPDAFGSTYAKLSDGLQYSIAVDAKEMNKGGAKYFLLEDAREASYSGEKIKQIYKDKGMKCEQKK